MSGDKRRLIAVCSLAGVCLLLWARLIFLEKIPRTGYADPEGEGTPPAAQVAGSTGQDAGSSIEVASGNKGNSKPEIQISLPTTLMRNVFAHPAEFDAELSERLPSRIQAAKSEPDTPDPIVLERQHADEIQAEAARLNLESIMHGVSPLAIINGRVVRPGEQVDGFELRRVNETSVILSRDGITVRLEINRPGSPDDPGG
ncbi:MAG: hypothetical protein HND57_07240 [Planctomycetes bacterium]|nr:hypothetical protein [Planctomycetota bacterium]